MQFFLLLSLTFRFILHQKKNDAAETSEAYLVLTLYRWPILQHGIDVFIFLILILISGNKMFSQHFGSTSNISHTVDTQHLSKHRQINTGWDKHWHLPFVSQCSFKCQCLLTRQIAKCYSVLSNAGFSRGESPYFQNINQNHLNFHINIEMLIIK